LRFVQSVSDEDGKVLYVGTWKTETVAPTTTPKKTMSKRAK
jgi:hypothetical protein